MATLWQVLERRGTQVYHALKPWSIFRTYPGAPQLRSFTAARKPATSFAGCRSLRAGILTLRLPPLYRSSWGRCLRYAGRNRSPVMVCVRMTVGISGANRTAQVCYSPLRDCSPSLYRPGRKTASSALGCRQLTLKGLLSV